VECFEDMVERFDRFNIGTNDLTQYTLAADRNNQDVSCYYSTYHPAVIRMIERICRIGNDAKKSICLCGEVASDLEATALWLGLGVRELSVPYRYVPALKQKIQSLDLDACRALAEKACRQNSAKKVRDLVRASSKLTVMTSEADL
jgi:phosphoenolpyruvate-protein kinase (PTS system EI component)